MKKIFIAPLVLLLATTVLLSGCASIVSKSSHPVYIHTNPVGTNITITDKKGKEVYKGRSPAKVILQSGAGYFSKAEYKVTLSSAGYTEKVVPISYKLNEWYLVI